MPSMSTSDLVMSDIVGEMCANTDRYFTEGAFDPIAVVAGLIQTAIYADFGYIVRHLQVLSSKLQASNSGQRGDEVRRAREY